MFRLTHRRLAKVLLVAALALSSAASFSHAGGALVDPTRPPHVMPTKTAHGEATTPWTLSAILVARGRRVAVVNGTPVQAGETVDDATVKHIARERVVLATREGTLTLRLVHSNVKQPEAARP